MKNPTDTAVPAAPQQVRHRTPFDSPLSVVTAPATGGAPMTRVAMWATQWTLARPPRASRSRPLFSERCCTLRCW
jgi:hypothetical protein